MIEQQSFIVELCKRLAKSAEKQEQHDTYLLKKIEDLTNQVEKQGGTAATPHNATAKRKDRALGSVL